MQEKLFGTDGIRGEANVYPMRPDLVLKVGQAIGHLLWKQEYPWVARRPKVVIGKDTRLSGYMIEQALSSGLNSMGVDVQLVGPLPTPGIGYLTRTMRASAGIVISASHNQFQDNGIKVFGYDGFKIKDSMEQEIESLVYTGGLDQLLTVSREVGRTRRIEDAQGRYIVHVKSTFPLEYTLDGLRMVLDTAHGAGYKVAPQIFSELGAEVIQIGDQPNGTNINDKVGALYPDRLSQMVLEYRADIGVALDGDGDRILIVDEKGKVMNGDHILGICALHMKKKASLKRNTLAVTQMSNFGLEKRMRENGIEVVKTSVGDKYVVDEMRRSDLSLGGEPSGHIIFSDHSTTGDGCIAALAVLAIHKETGVRISELNRVVEDVPQVLINCRVKNRKDLSLVPGFTDLLQEVESKLSGRGRIFVRYSGTEPLIRILVEGDQRVEITEYAEKMAHLLSKELS